MGYYEENDDVDNTVLLVEIPNQKKKVSFFDRKDIINDEILNFITTWPLKLLLL